MERYDINSIPKANTAEAGALRVANSVDEKNCNCVDAAITPSNLYNLLGCRKANTSYTVGEIVTCPYHPEFLLKCTVAGSTATGSLDTTSATLGKVYSDGGVKWEVIVLPIELGGTGAITSTQALENLGAIPLSGSNKLGQFFLKSIDTENIVICGGTNYFTSATLILDGNQCQSNKNAGGFMLCARNADVSKVLKGFVDGKLIWNDTPVAVTERYVTERYVSGYNWYEKYSDGWVRQCIYATPAQEAIAVQTVNLLVPMRDTSYSVNGAMVTGRGGAGITAQTAGISIGQNSTYKTTTTISLSLGTTFMEGKYVMIEGYGA